MSAVFQQLSELIAHWFCSDRVRISPTAGRLLGLNPGDRLLLRGELYRVSTRELLSDGVLYQLDDSSQPVQLVIRQNQDTDSLYNAPSVGELLTGNYRVSVWDDDVTLIHSDAPLSLS